MAELSENDINNIISRVADAINNSVLSTKSDETNQKLDDLKAKAERTVRAIRQSTKSAFSIATESTKGSAKDKAQEKNSNKDKLTRDKKSTNVFQQMSNYLKEINETLKKAYAPDPTKLSGATQDAGSPVKEKSEVKKQTEKKAEDTKSSSVPWLSLLFAGGAVAAISKAFGIGAGAGVAGGVLAKLLPAVLGPFKFLAKRMPIIGSLFSFYEAYKKFKQGGIDNIVFGIMDLAAGIAYAFPGVGTAIGLGVDVLQYFLKNKATEFKKETGETSFFGSLYDSIIEYLSETAMVKWMVQLGDLFGAIWDNPTDLNTWIAFGNHVAGPFQSFIAMLQNFDQYVGESLGVTDGRGEAVGFTDWIHDLIDEYLVTPLMDTVTTVFTWISEQISAAASAVTDTARDMFSWLPFVDSVEEKQSTERAEQQKIEQEQKLYQGKSAEQLKEREKLLRQIETSLQDLYPLDPSKRQLGSEQGLSVDQLRERDADLKRQLNNLPSSVPDTQNIPKPQSMMGPEATRFRSRQQTTNNIVNTSVTNNVAALTPSQVLAH